MSRKREKRTRLQWFAMDVDAFLDDPRMQYLTTREKSFWAQIIIRSFRTCGVVVTDPHVVADQTGATLKEAKILVGKLIQYKLLIPVECKVYEAVSPRLANEYEIANEAHQKVVEAGKARARDAQRNQHGQLETPAHASAYAPADQEYRF